MKTNEIFEHVLQIVCEECELCYGELINGANAMVLKLPMCRANKRGYLPVRRSRIT